MAPESPFFSPFCLCLKNRFFSKFFVCSLCCALLCFFSLSSFCAQFFFFWERSSWLFFSTKQAQPRSTLHYNRRERKEGKDFETFLSLFFPLFDTNTTPLARTRRQRRRTRPVLFILLLPRVVKFYIEKDDSKKRRAIDFDWFARHHPEGGREKPKIDEEERLFSTHVNISLSLSLD